MFKKCLSVGSNLGSHNIKLPCHFKRPKCSLLDILTQLYAILDIFFRIVGEKPSQRYNNKLRGKRRPLLEFYCISINSFFNAYNIKPQAPFPQPS